MRHHAARSPRKTARVPAKKKQFRFLFDRALLYRLLRRFERRVLQKIYSFPAGALTVFLMAEKLSLGVPMNASKWMVIFAVVLLTALPVFASGSSLEHSPEVEFNLADPWWTRTTWLVFGVIFNWGWHFLVGRIPGKRGEVRKAVGVWLNEKRQARMTVLKSLSAPMELTIHSEDFLLQPALEEGPVSYCIVRCVAHEWAIGMARVEYTSWNQINVAFFLHGNRKIPRISFER